MQEGFINYFDKESEGCCLNCERAEIGCMCFNCKCKKCYWYSDNRDGTGFCDKKDELKLERKKSFLANLKIRYKFESEKSNKLDMINKGKEKKIRESGKIPNVFSCQKCQREIISEDELKIVQFKFPLCLICKGCL